MMDYSAFLKMNRNDALNTLMQLIISDNNKSDLERIFENLRNTKLKSKLTPTDVAIAAGDAFIAKPGGHTQALAKTLAYCLDQDGVDLRALDQRFSGQDEYFAGVIREKISKQELPAAPVPAL